MLRKFVFATAVSLYSIGATMVALLMLFSMVASADAKQTVNTPDTLTVAIAPVAPFAFKDPVTGQWTGISIQLWQQIASRNGYQYKYVEMPLGETIVQLTNHNIDVALGAISLTESRERAIDFTHPYFTSGLGVVTKHTPVTIMGYIFSWMFAKHMGVIVLLIVAFGVVILILERKHNQQLDTLEESTWWAIVTITTTGYGDLVPKTKSGRMFAAVCMLIGAVVFPSMIGSISARLTVDAVRSNISSIHNISKYKIAVVPGTTGEYHFISNNWKYVKADNVIQLLEMVNSGQVDGAVYDAPILKYHLPSYPSLNVLPTTLDYQYYGLMLQPHSKLREPINSQMLNIIGSKQWSGVLKSYLNNF